MGFNLDNYEPVADRLARAHSDHPDMRVITDLVAVERNADGKPIQYIVRAQIWLGDVLKAQDYAEEMVGSSPVNRTSALENCTTSSIGRALADMGYQGNVNGKASRPSREDMEKVARAENDQRHGQQQAENDQRHRAMGRRRDGEHVVERHDHVGQRDRAHRGPQLWRRRDILFLGLVDQKLDRDPQQQDAADQFQKGQIQQVRHDRRENHAQADGGARAKPDAKPPLFGGQRPACQRDDHRVVAGQQQIDPDDFGDGEQGGRIRCHRKSLTRLARLVERSRAPEPRAIAPLPQWREQAWREWGAARSFHQVAPRGAAARE